jgi:hypothetical protein
MWRECLKAWQEIMRTISAIVIIAMLGLVAIAQRADNNTDEQLKARNAPDVFVYTASAYGPDKQGNSNFTIGVHNTGAKTITAIEWEYNSPDDVAGRGKVMKSRNDKLNVRPEEKKKLALQVHHYTDQFVKDFQLNVLRIVRVEYMDGSSWQRPADDK